MKQQLARSQALFPENPSVWVKDLAGYLNLHLTTPEIEPTLSSYAHGPSDLDFHFIMLKRFQLILYATACQHWTHVHLFSLVYVLDYPYCLTGKELRGIIKNLIGRCSNVLPDFFDHCVYTMLRELDRQSGTPKSFHGDLKYLLFTVTILIFSIILSI